jgi:hypothetical protein
MRERPGYLTVTLKPNLSEIPTGCFRRQFTIIIDMFDMLNYVRPCGIE